jgi:hypothetical protein
MKWLQRTFTTRINRLRNERIHVFQGRYKAILIGEGLCREDFLSILGEPNSLAGMRRYATHLKLSQEGDPKRRDVLAKRNCCGWFIGAKEEKKALEKDLRERHPDVVRERSELKVFNEVMWEGLVVKALAAVSKSKADIQSELKGAPWKARVARTLLAQTTAGNPWIAKRLNTGHQFNSKTLAE